MDEIKTVQIRSFKIIKVHALAALPESHLDFGYPLSFDAKLVNKLMPCALLSSGNR